MSLSGYLNGLPSDFWSWGATTYVERNIHPIERQFKIWKDSWKQELVIAERLTGWLVFWIWWLSIIWLCFDTATKLKSHSGIFRQKRENIIDFWVFKEKRIDTNMTMINSTAITTLLCLCQFSSFSKEENLKLHLFYWICRCAHWVQIMFLSLVRILYS